ncbi:MAG: glycoside hydrolase family 127 protein, partial [Opitutales bacterium]|nr:glycoside hydrolase family 127 protein [Opitutales bacterium]
EYLETAIKLLELRGRNEYARKLLAEGGGGFDKLSYSQQHMPVSEQREPAGHAVRAMYQYTAMALADAMSGRNDYSAALDSIWSNIVSTRMSITGGLGAVNSIEGFGREYFLPNKTAYNETCAAVASVFFGHAMFMRTLDAKYLDILEITLFNGALSGIGLEGDTFFYENPLEADGVSAFNHGSNARVKWMSCACCPPNISRLIMRMTGFFYARDAENLWVNMYATSSAKFNMGAAEIGVEQKSDYPFGGDTSIGLSLAKPLKFALRLRIPTWASGENFTPGALYRYAFPAARKPAIKINGEAAEFKTEKGFAVLERVWKDGDTVELSLPMRPMAVLCDGRVEDNAGRAAIVRGPLVYCAEQFDNGAVGKIYLSNLRETQNGAKADVFTGGKLKGIGFVKIPCKKLGDDGWTEALLVPYFAWNNRGAGSMSVWLPISKSLAQNGAASRRGALRSLVESVSASDGSQLVGSILDGEIPASSAKIDVPSWKTCEFDKDGFAYADIKFKRPVEVDAIGAYFGTLNGLGIPKTWKISYSLGAEPLRDMEVYQTDSYNTERDKFNVVHPAKPFKCDRLRVWLKVDNYRVMLCELDISAK